MNNPCEHCQNKGYCKFRKDYEAFSDLIFKRIGVPVFLSLTMRCDMYKLHNNQDQMIDSRKKPIV